MTHAPATAHDDLSPRALRTAAAFGLRLATGADAPPPPAASPPPDSPDATAAALDESLAPGQTCLLTGPSGAGKSTTLCALAHRLGAGAIVVPAFLDADISPAARVIDLFRSPLERTLGLLSSAGLGDAPLFLQHPTTLSDGQRSRLLLALAMEAAERRRRLGLPATLIADEFASTLDRATARALAHTAARWARAAAARLVVATAHDDLERALAPSVVATFSLAAPPRLLHRDSSPAASPLAHIDIRPATRNTYAHLARFHYRAGPPATCIHTLAAFDTNAPDPAAPIGVLTISMPTLNSPLRDLAWPGRYRTASKPADAARLNAELRTISRVIVDPRYRGIGLAAALVRAYLAHPLTPHTEAIAAMGRWCPFFESAGMQPFPLPLPRRHTRLLAALSSLSIEPWELADPPRILARLRTADSDAPAAHLARELAIWADASRSTRRHARTTDLRTLLDLAARAAPGAPSIGYAHTTAATAHQSAA